MSLLPLTYHTQNPMASTGDTKKRRNLMSIINSLNPPTTSNMDPGCSLDNFTTDSETVFSDAGISPSQQELDLNPGGMVLQEAPEKKDEGEVVTNILKLLYQVASSDPIETPQPQSSDPVMTPHENDESILEMQNAPQGSKSGILNLIKCYKNGTLEVKSILDNDVNFLYECKRCRGIFRSLPSLIKHKKEFCKNSGLYSTFMNRGSNSTPEEDDAFRKVLDILHPAENTYFDKRPQFSPPPLQRKESSLIKNPPALNIGASVVRMTTPSGIMSPVVYESTSSPVAGSSTSTSTTSSNHFGKFYITQPDKKYSCPTCGKSMVERKNIRRHLVNVHRMRVYDALKLMNSVKELRTPTKEPPSKSKVMPKSVQRPDSEVLDQCVETIKLGPKRVIHVLSETYNLSSARCPVCKRGFCRRTNVRRHILEAHNLIIKGDKKYFQLKDIASKNISNTPSLRALRHMFMSNNNSTGTNTVSSTMSSITSKPHTSWPTVTTSRPTSQQVNKPVTILPLPSTTISKVRENGGYFTIDKVKFVTTNNTSPVLLKQLPSSAPKMSSIAGKVGVHDNQNSVSPKNQDLQALDKLTKTVDSKNQDVSQSQDGSYSPAIWCPKCNTTMKYVSSFKTHMTNVHSYSEKEYVELLKQMNIPDPSFGTFSRRRSSDETEDDPPPKRLRELAPPSESIKQEVFSEPECVVNGHMEKNILSSLTQESDASSTGSSVAPGPLHLRRFSPEMQPVTASSTGLRPFIKVKVKNPNIPTSASATKSTSTTSFDFKKLICYSCDKKFLSAPDMKRHLLGVHSFTVEDALASCYDCSDVSPEVQNAALQHGFDIILAKCLLCQKLYFSRECLYRHLTKFHHMEERVLAGLKNSITSHNDKFPMERRDAKVPSKTTTTIKTVTISTQPIDSETATPKSKAAEKSPKKEPAEGSPASSTPVSSPSLYTVAQRPKSISGNIFAFSEEDAEEALKVFPKNFIKANTMRCVKCRHKYQKAWDLKVHMLIKHLDLGLYACKFCPKSDTKYFSRAGQIVKHINEVHKLRTRNRDNLLTQCRVDLDKLWEMYDLPTRKSNGRY